MSEDDAFALKALELLGPYALANSKLSHYDTAKMFWEAAIEHLRRNGDPVEWRCFHCDEVFADSEAAALHFGTSLFQKSVCTLEASHLREMETRLNRYQEEDTDLHREMHKARGDHHAALQRAEEAGYSRGLRDAAPQPLPSAEVIAGLLSTFPPHDKWHPNACMGMANAVLELLKGKK